VKHIPPEIIEKLEAETDGISHGSVMLTVHLRNDRPYRFIISRECSLLDPSASVIPEKARSNEKTV
jgi:hypothetical protein